MTYKILNAWILNGISQNSFQISRPVHVIFKSDKLDYLRCPRKEIFFDNFFSTEQGPSNVGKLNWDLLGFFSFMFSLTWGAWLDHVKLNFSPPAPSSSSPG